MLKLKLMLTQPPTELELELGLSLAIYKNYVLNSIFFIFDIWSALFCKFFNSCWKMHSTLFEDASESEE